MFALNVPAVLAMAAAQMVGPTIGPPVFISPPSLTQDGETLAAALAGPALELAVPGARAALQVEALAADHGCAALAITRTEATGSWSRLFRWSDVAWTGTMSDGRTLVAFFEPQGRLPTDRLAFAPTDPVAFRAALARVMQACRGERDETHRVVATDYAGVRSCYFARTPGLELVEATVPEAVAHPSRAVFTALAHETPEAELRLLFERPFSGGADGEAGAEVAFTVAAPAIDPLRVTEARFMLDGKTIAAAYSIIRYGDTRLRIRMSGEDFYGHLSASASATLTLLDGEGQTHAVLNFDTGQELLAARRVLDEAEWSCGSAYQPTPPADWQLAS